MEIRGRDDNAMTDRIHEGLDGKLSRSELTERERRKLGELEALVRESLAFTRDAPVPDLEPAVMERIREMDGERSLAGRADRGVPEVLGDLVAWLWTPRPFRVRPAWAFAALMVLALGAGVLPLRTGQPGGTGPAIASGEADGSVLQVRFELEAEEASSVSVAGTFNGWQPDYELAEIAPGRWTGLVPLEPGVHEYAFVVDGERWVADPHAPRVSDGFGGVNSRIALVAPRRDENGGPS